MRDVVEASCVFHIFSGSALVGTSNLESGDPPMGVASGQFLPTDAFALLRNQMIPTLDGDGKGGVRYIAGLCAKTVDGGTLTCEDVSVFEYGDVSATLGLEVVCLGIEYPLYGALFPHHVKAYDDQFQK